jgi:hypothetical protein
MKTLMAATVATMLLASAAMAQSGMSTPSMDPMRGNPAIQMRTLMQYDMGAWMAPAAVVLNSAEDWASWNEEMVAQGKAVGVEAAPAVDWSREAVVVVCLGENPTGNWRVEMKSARKVGKRASVQVHVTMDAGGSAPCHVIAMEKLAAQALQLSCDCAVAGMPRQAQVYTGGGLQLASAEGGSLNQVSWGALKHEYR